MPEPSAERAAKGLCVLSPHRPHLWWSRFWTPGYGCGGPYSAACEQCWALSCTARVATRVRPILGYREARKTNSLTPYPDVKPTEKQWACHHALTQDGKWNGRLTLVNDQFGNKGLCEPFHWRPGQVVATWFMGDLFGGDRAAYVDHWGGTRPIEIDLLRASVFQRMADTPQHTYLVLTKQPQEMRRWMEEWWTPDKTVRFKRGGTEHEVPRLYLRQKDCDECRFCFLGCLRGRKKWADKADKPNWREAGHVGFWGREEWVCDGFEWAVAGEHHGVAVEMAQNAISVRDECCHGGFPGPLKNVMLGTTVSENTDLWRVEELVKTPAACRFVNAHLLGPLDLRKFLTR